MVSFQTKLFDENPKSLTQVNLDMSKSADDRMDCRSRPRVMSLMSLCLPLVRTDRLEMAHCITGQTSEKCRSNSEKSVTCHKGKSFYMQNMTIYNNNHSLKLKWKLQVVECLKLCLMGCAIRQLNYGSNAFAVVVKYDCQLYWP